MLLEIGECMRMAIGIDANLEGVVRVYYSDGAYEDAKLEDIEENRSRYDILTTELPKKLSPKEYHLWKKLNILRSINLYQDLLLKHDELEAPGQEVWLKTRILELLGELIS